MSSSKIPEAAVSSSHPGNLGPLLGILRQDRIARAASLFFLAALFFFALSLGEPTLRQAMSRHVLPLLFLGLTLCALLKSLAKIESPEERRFWVDLAMAYGCWLTSRLIHLLVPESTGRAVVEDLLYGLFYLGMVMALERRVHRRGEWRPTRLERALSWPGVAVFVLGILLYFVFIPLKQDLNAYLGGLPSLHYYVSLDIYLTLTAIYLARTSYSRRWKTLYSMLTLTVGSTLLSDLSEVFGLFQGWVLGGPYDGLWNVPLVAMILTARMRHVHFPSHRQSHQEKLQQEGNLSGPNGRTMVMALAFPLAHFAGYSSGVLDPLCQPQREVLIFWWLLLLGTISFIQQRILNRSFRSMMQDRTNFEESLRSSKQDLRFMIESHHSSEQIRLSELKFFKAFRASPDVMVISSAEDGRLIEVNDSFERILGYRREEAVGRTAAELGLWNDPEERQQITRALQDEQGVKDLELRFIRRDGDVGLALFSAELITIEGESCLLSVAHDITQRRRLESRLDDETSYLQNLDSAAVVTDLEHHVIFWNTAAEDLFGWSETEVPERSLLDVLGADHEAQWSRAIETLENSGRWNGSLDTHHRDGTSMRIEAWWSQIRNERNHPRPKFLFVAQQAATSDNAQNRAQTLPSGIDQVPSKGHEGQG